MKILFVHEAPGQFGVLHQYLNSQGLAESWLMCSKGVYDREKAKIPNLVPFVIPKEDDKAYFYTRKLEGRVKRSFQLRHTILEFLKQHKIDVIVTHGSGGFPMHLFGEIDVPIITYIEFPSFTHHGHDEKYPQPEYARYVDKIFEMTSFHQVIRSDMVIVPSEYAKSMFPNYLHHKIVAQMEGFNIERGKPTYEKEKDKFHIGFAARDLSSAKGFEQFILIAKEILSRRDDVKFVFCGSPKVLYSYESVMLQKLYGNDNKKNFMEYLLEREGIDLEDSKLFSHVEFASYDDFVGYVESMDMFLYPLQFGSANWGIFELLFRSKLVIASDRCFVPEIIKNMDNGILCDYNDIKGWADKVDKVIDNYDQFMPIAQRARERAVQKYSIANVCERYLTIFEAAISHKKIAC